MQAEIRVLDDIASGSHTTVFSRHNGLPKNPRSTQPDTVVRIAMLDTSTVPEDIEIYPTSTIMDGSNMHDTDERFKRLHHEYEYLAHGAIENESGHTSRYSMTTLQCYINSGLYKISKGSEELGGTICGTKKLRSHFKFQRQAYGIRNVPVDANRQMLRLRVQVTSYPCLSRTICGLH